MSFEIGVKTSQKTELKTTQLQKLVKDLTEQEQELISGFGGPDDGWCNGFSIGESQAIQKQWLNSNFRVNIGGLPCD
ncbi:MAG: hypothetical protein AB1589_07935 [Cyanobacteriota bacterium]